MSSEGKRSETADILISLINKWGKVEGNCPGINHRHRISRLWWRFLVFFFSWSFRGYNYWGFFMLNGTIKDFMHNLISVFIYHLSALTNCMSRAALVSLKCCGRQSGMGMNYTGWWGVKNKRLELLPRQLQTQRYNCPGQPCLSAWLIHVLLPRASTDWCRRKSWGHYSVGTWKSGLV